MPALLESYVFQSFTRTGTPNGPLKARSIGSTLNKFLIRLGYDPKLTKPHLAFRGMAPSALDDVGGARHLQAFLGQWTASNIDVGSAPMDLYIHQDVLRRRHLVRGAARNSLISSIQAGNFTALATPSNFAPTT